eukprot:3714095-Amphidinium_carterae.2
MKLHWCPFEAIGFDNHTHDCSSSMHGEDEVRPTSTASKLNREVITADERNGRVDQSLMHWLHFCSVTWATPQLTKVDCSCECFWYAWPPVARLTGALCLPGTSYSKISTLPKSSRLHLLMRKTY